MTEPKPQEEQLPFLDDEALQNLANDWIEREEISDEMHHLNWNFSKFKLDLPIMMMNSWELFVE